MRKFTQSPFAYIRRGSNYALDAVKHFNCDKTGTQDTTARMLEFWQACANEGRPGFIPPGDYLVAPGQLVFDTPFVDALAPTIETLGHQSVTFLASASVNAPFITYTNGTPTSGAGRYWQGGRIGGITFSQNGQATAANQHAISLRGTNRMRLGHFVANDVGGSSLSIPQFLFGGSNPDPVAVTACLFEGVEANRVQGRIIDNQNYVGLNGCRFGYVRGIQTVQGGVFGAGSGNIFDVLSIGQCTGWAWDDGNSIANTGGSAFRSIVLFAELDGNEFGISLNRQTLSKFYGIRFNHRYAFSPAPLGQYYPKKAILLCGGSLAGSVTQVAMEVTHRIEAGMSPSALNLVVGNNPITTVNGSSTITFNTTNAHGFTNGWTIAILNAAATNGIPAASINGERVCTVTGANSFTVVAGAAATASGTGGGATIALSPLEALGVFVDTNNSPNVFGVEIEQLEINNAGFTSITNDPSRLYTNVSANSSFLLTRLGRAISDTRIVTGFIARGATGRTILSQTLSQTTSKQIYTTALRNRVPAPGTTGNLAYDTATGLFYVPETGDYDVYVCDTFAPNALSQVVEMAIARFSAGAFAAVVSYAKHSFPAGQFERTFDVPSRKVTLTKGDQLGYIVTQTTSAGAVSGTSTTSGSTSGMLFSAFLVN